MASSRLARFRAMARDSAWADAPRFDACAWLGDSAVGATRRRLFPSLHETLDHLHIVDRDDLDDGRPIDLP